jgi:hypothetical protein
MGFESRTFTGSGFFLRARQGREKRGRLKAEAFRSMSIAHAIPWTSAGVGRAYSPDMSDSTSGDRKREIPIGFTVSCLLPLFPVERYHALDGPMSGKYARPTPAFFTG